jgi:hypothetical protein
MINIAAAPFVSLTLASLAGRSSGVSREGSGACALQSYCAANASDYYRCAGTEAYCTANTSEDYRCGGTPAYCAANPKRHVRCAGQ